MADESPAAVDTYIATLSPLAQERVSQIRAIVRDLAPESSERISYKILAFRTGKRDILYCAGYMAHIGLYPVTDDLLASFNGRLDPYRCGKATLRFAHTDPLPIDLIREIFASRLRTLAGDQ